MEDVIELTDRTRLVITPDPVPLDVRDPEVCITGCYTPPSWWGHPTEGPAALHDFPGNIVEADDRLWADDSWEPERAIKRWAWSFYGLELQRHGATYWYCDRNMFDSLHGGEFTREVQSEVIRSEREDYRRYVDREARIVTLQRLARFRRTTRKYHEHHQDLLEVWETIASVGDTYLDPSYTEADVAFECFTPHLTKKELTIVTAMIDSQRTERGPYVTR
jgi:hypothetical protein